MNFIEKAMRRLEWRRKTSADLPLEPREMHIMLLGVMYGMFGYDLRVNWLNVCENSIDGKIIEANRQMRKGRE